MPVLGTDDGKPFWIYTGFRVERRGRHHKWEECAIYCSREAAQRAIDRMWGKNHITDAPRECRIVEIEV